MTSKFRKRMARERQRQTGEQYTAALRWVTRTSQSSRPMTGHIVSRTGARIPRYGKTPHCPGPQMPRSKPGIRS